VIPGSQIPFVLAKEKDSATIDVIGEARTADSKFAIGHQRDTVKLALDSAQQVRHKNVQYNTGFLLAPGNYHLKLWCAKISPGAWARSRPMCKFPTYAKPRCA